MASQQTGFQSGSRTDWRNCFASATCHINDPHPQDVLCEVKDKLVAVIDLFNFYDSLEFYNKAVSFRKETVSGAVRIIDDCVDKLNGLYAKWE